MGRRPHRHQPGPGLSSRLDPQGRQRRLHQAGGRCEGGVLVGATSAGPTGGEVLSMLTLAVHAADTCAAPTEMIYAYPTFHRAVEDALSQLGSGCDRLGGPSPVPPEQPLPAQRDRPDDDEQADVEQQLHRRASRLVPAIECDRQGDVGSGRDGGDGDKPPISAPARDSVRDTTPTIPATTATTTENRFGELIRSDTGLTPRRYSSGASPSPRMHKAKSRVTPIAPGSPPAGRVAPWRTACRLRRSGPERRR